MPAILGGLLSVLMAGIATREEYDQYNIDMEIDSKSSLVEIFPERASPEWTGGTQASMQLAAMIVTMVFAVVGGFITGKGPLKDYVILSGGGGVTKTLHKITRGRRGAVSSETLGLGLDTF